MILQRVRFLRMKKPSNAYRAQGERVAR